MTRRSWDWRSWDLFQFKKCDVFIMHKKYREEDGGRMCPTMKRTLTPERFKFGDPCIVNDNKIIG